MLVASGTLVAS
ncbi:unnamed protein product, partial [Didymodactylos carnosus]